MLLFGINLFSKNSKNNFIEDYFMLILARCLKIFSILLKEWTTSYSQKIFLWVIASNLSIIGNNYSVLNNYYNIVHKYLYDIYCL